MARKNYRLPRWPVGQTHRGMIVEFESEDGSDFSLGGATSYDAQMINRLTREARDVTGSITLNQENDRALNYAPSAADVSEAGTWQIKFRAQFPDASSDVSFYATWEITEGVVWPVPPVP